MSIRSANETEHHLVFARDVGLLSPDDWHRLSAETIEIREMIYGYRKKVLSRKQKEQPSRVQRQHDQRPHDHLKQEQPQKK